MEALEILDLQKNAFKKFPEQLCHLKNLKNLNLNENGDLETLDSGIQAMSALSELSLHSCYALSSPPLNFCNQGILAVKQYFTDLERGVSESLPSVTVAIIGRALAGKTSLIWTLQRQERCCTGYVKGDHRATQVFEFEDVEVQNTKFRFIDFGGQDIYHQTYRLTLRENCIPVVVVDLKEYDGLSRTIGDREAVRQSYFDWMAHLYLAQPNLPPPMLVLTHKDMFPDEEFEKVKSRFLATSNAVRNTIVTEIDQLNRPRFDNPEQPLQDLFAKQDIYSIGIDEDYSIFEKLTKQLHDCFQVYVQKVPKIWDEVDAIIRKQETGFLRFTDLLDLLQPTHLVFDKDQLEIVLSYLHDCGKVLWYKNVDLLKDYVFHKIPEVTKLLKILFDHRDEKARWHCRARDFQPCYINSKRFDRDLYNKSVEQFEEGIISSSLLAYFIQSESVFKEDESLNVALKLLTSFRLVFGPVWLNNECSYIAPHLRQRYLASRPRLDSDIQLYVELVFKGLGLPRYVFHEMTAGIFDLSSPKQATPSAFKNGATVVVGGCTVRLVHDAKSGKASISVSSNVDVITESWKLLVEIVNGTIKRVRETWKAVKLVCILHCPHCKLKGSKYVQKTENPQWCVLHEQPSAEDTRKRVISKRMNCGKDIEDVHAALISPCKLVNQSSILGNTMKCLRAKNQSTFRLFELRLLKIC